MAWMRLYFACMMFFLGTGQFNAVSIVPCLGKVLTRDEQLALKPTKKRRTKKGCKGSKARSRGRSICAKAGGRGSKGRGKGKGRSSGKGRGKSSGKGRGRGGKGKKGFGQGHAWNNPAEDVEDPKPAPKKRCSKKSSPDAGSCDEPKPRTKKPRCSKSGKPLDTTPLPCEAEVPALPATAVATHQPKKRACPREATSEAKPAPKAKSARTSTAAAKPKPAPKAKPAAKANPTPAALAANPATPKAKAKAKANPAGSTSSASGVAGDAARFLGYVREHVDELKAVLVKQWASSKPKLKLADFDYGSFHFHNCDVVAYWSRGAAGVKSRVTKKQFAYFYWDLSQTYHAGMALKAAQILAPLTYQ